MFNNHHTSTSLILWNSRFPAFHQRFGRFDNLRLLRWVRSACEMFSSELELNWPSKPEHNCPSAGVCTDSWISWVAEGWPCRSEVIGHWISTRLRSINRFFFLSWKICLHCIRSIAWIFAFCLMRNYIWAEGLWGRRELWLLPIVFFAISTAQFLCGSFVMKHSIGISAWSIIHIPYFSFCAC
jgi:hypothetical protein